STQLTAPEVPFPVHQTRTPAAPPPHPLSVFQSRVSPSLLRLPAATGRLVSRAGPLLVAARCTGVERGSARARYRLLPRAVLLT
ncbi:hypothetical protein EJB05_35047, partial [Eragrostis curvula]